MGCGSGRPLSAASVFPAAAPAALGMWCLGCFHARFILLTPHSAERVESASRRPPQPASPCSPDLGARWRVRRSALPSVEVAARRAAAAATRGMTARENLQAQLRTTEFRGWEHARPDIIFRPDLGRKGRIFFCRRCGRRRRAPIGGRASSTAAGVAPGK